MLSDYGDTEAGVPPQGSIGGMLSDYGETEAGVPPQGSIGGMLSDYGETEAGVQPQGSILGPLLFLIHTNDNITDNMQSGIKLFAADASLFIAIDNGDIEATEQLDNDLQIGKEWAKKWLVSFSPQKTKSLYVTFKKDNKPLLFDGQACENVVCLQTSHYHRKHSMLR